MKKAILTACFAMMAILGFSQKGNWYLGGVAGYGSNTWKPTEGDDYKTNTWAFGPEFGTFLHDDLQLGFILGLNGSNTKDGDEEVLKSSFFAPTIYVRKFKKVTDNFSAFTGLYFNYGSGKVEEDGNERTGNSFGINLGIGIAYALSPRFTAVGQYGVLGYSSTTYKEDGEETGKESDFNLGVNTVGSGSFVQGNGSGAVFNIGIYYTLSTGTAKK